MLSKQQKLRYGQILRQQMKEKEEKKKVEDMQKRGSYRQPQMLPIREQPAYLSPQVQRKDNAYMRQPPSYIDPKEQLQKRLQSQDYNPFGGLGGGAPNRRVDQNPQNMRNMSQPGQVRMAAEQMMYQPNSYNNLPPQRVRTITQQNDNYPPQYHPSQMQSISPQSMSYPPRLPQSMYYQEGPYSSIPQQGRMPNNPYQQQQPNLPSTREYPPYSNNNYREEPQRQQPSFDILMQNQQPSHQMIQQQQSYLPSSNQYPPMQQQPSSMLPMEQPQSYNQPSNENMNQELQEVYKKGGRNLLKLQNQTVDEQLMKQRRKQQIQKQLKLQIEEAQRRKKEEKQKLKKAQQEQERKHLQYLAQQKRRVEEEQRKKMEEKQRIIDENLKNIQLKKKMQEEAKRKVQQERLERQRKNRQFQKQKDDEIKRQQQIQRKKTIAIQAQESLNDDSASVVSSVTSQLEKDFNTALSREFFRKQREKSNPSSYQNKKLEQFSSQIQHINRQMAHQRQLMERQIQLMRNEAQRAKTDKKKAEQEIQQLKRELKNKMDEENDKLLRALQGNDFRVDNYNHLSHQNYKNLNEPPSNQYQPFVKKPLKQRQNENLVRKEFEVEKRKFIPHQEQLSQFQQSQVGEMVSLEGESKKIPVYLENSDKLTMSQVQNFAKDSSFFQKGVSSNINKNSPMKKQKFNMKVSQSIAQQPEQERQYMNNQSRKSSRYKPEKRSSRQERDELDRLIDSRAKSRKGWDEMSSVNEDITKEIEELLRKKENPIGGGNNARPSSISNAGRQTLAKQGYAYDGLTLNSHVSHVGGTLNTNGTVDLERINGRNDARLRELKNLGVQTVNTNGDDDLNALDQLLNKYK